MFDIRFWIEYVLKRIIYFSRCEFEIDLRIKPVSKITIQRDQYRAQYPCFIVLKGAHNHSLESAMGLQQLRVLPKTREEFFRYFEMGEYDRFTYHHVTVWRLGLQLTHHSPVTCNMVLWISLIIIGALFFFEWDNFSLQILYNLWNISCNSSISNVQCKSVQYCTVYFRDALDILPSYIKRTVSLQVLQDHKHQEFIKKKWTSVLLI